MMVKQIRNLPSHKYRKFCDWLRDHDTCIAELMRSPDEHQLVVLDEFEKNHNLKNIWINVAEDLPEEGVLVLVSDGKRVDVGSYVYLDDISDVIWDVELAFCDPDSISLWMEFPEDPREIGVLSVKD